MKRSIALLLVVALLTTNVCALADGGLWDKIKKKGEEAASWAQEKGEAAASWAEEKGGEALSWAEEKGGEALSWAEEKGGEALSWAEENGGKALFWAQENGGKALSWAQQKGSEVATSVQGTDAWKWIQGAGGEAWDWTKSAVDTAGSWIAENAGKAWDVTSKKIGGTWNDVFGKAEDAGPRHLSITSPLFTGATLVGSWTDDKGLFTECYRYDDEYDITLITTARAGDVMPPSVGDVDFGDLVATCFEGISFVNGEASGVGVRAMAQELRFQAVQNDVPKFGRALCVWTDRYIVGLIITVDPTVEAYGVDLNALQRSDRIFDLFTQTIRVTEVKSYEEDAQTETSSGTSVGALTYGNVHAANRIIDEAKFHGAQGHGFAAESANNLADNVKYMFSSDKAEIVGNDFKKNGADRKITVDGVATNIQTKYCRSAKASVDACFDADGKFRYVDDGTPMMIEVPKDQYDQAVDYFQDILDNNNGALKYYDEVRGVDVEVDVENVKDVVRKGSVSYDQARNIAKAGTIDSIVYDVKNGSVECLSAFGISSVINFAVGMWNGAEIKDALKQSVLTGVEVGGMQLAISVLSSQISRAGLNSALRESSEALVKKLGTKGQNAIIRAFEGSSDDVIKGLSGAAKASKAAKLLRGNTITASVALLVISAPDFAEAFRGRISPKQLAKNVVVEAGNIAGGWVGGAAIGSLICPGVGTVVGGIISSVAGDSVARFITGTVADLLVEDDADEMLDIIAGQYEILAADYLLNEAEAGAVTEALGAMLTEDALKNMYAFSDHELYASEAILRPIIVKQVSERSAIELPEGEEYEAAMAEIVEAACEED